MLYAELRQKHQERIDALPLGFAFSDKQFKEVMAEWGLAENDTDKLFALPYGGGFYQRKDAELVRKTFEETHDEMERAMQDDDFCTSAILYELKNYEYGYTGEVEDALTALHLSLEDERTKRLLEIAKKQYWEEAEKRGW